MQLSPSDDSAVILGFPMDDALKSVIRFWDDPALKDQLVGYLPVNDAIGALKNAPNENG